MAPVLLSIPAQTVDVGKSFQLNIESFASDPNTPALPLRYSLGLGAPSGASINPTTGDLTWSLGANQQIGTYAITVHVSDNGSPPLSVSETFNVSVFDPGPAPTISAATISTKKSFTITLTFSEPVNPATAANPNDYILTEPAKKPKSKMKPAPPPTRIKLSVSYNQATNQVILKGPKTVKTSPALTLTVVGTGPNGIAKTDGLKLAGNGRQPGTNYVASVTKKAVRPLLVLTSQSIVDRTAVQLSEVHTHNDAVTRPRFGRPITRSALSPMNAWKHPAGPMALARTAVAREPAWLLRS